MIHLRVHQIRRCPVEPHDLSPSFDVLPVIRYKRHHLAHRPLALKLSQGYHVRLGSNSACFPCRSPPLNRLGLHFSATSLQSPPDTLTSNLRQARLIPRAPSYHRSRNSLSDLGTISNSVCERVAVKPRLSRQTHHPAGALSYQLPNQSAIAYLIARLGYVGATAFSASRKLLTPIIVIIPRQRRQLAAQAQ